MTTNDSVFRRPVAPNIPGTNLQAAVNNQATLIPIRSVHWMIPRMGPHGPDLTLIGSGKETIVFARDESSILGR